MKHYVIARDYTQEVVGIASIELNEEEFKELKELFYEEYPDMIAENLSDEDLMSNSDFWYLIGNEYDNCNFEYEDQDYADFEWNDHPYCEQMFEEEE